MARSEIKEFRRIQLIEATIDTVARHGKYVVLRFRSEVGFS